MPTHYPIVLEREDSGVFSAYVAGLPVYAQGPTRSRVASAIVRTVRASLDAHPQADRPLIPDAAGRGESQSNFSPRMPKHRTKRGKTRHQRARRINNFENPA